MARFCYNFFYLVVDVTIILIMISNEYSLPNQKEKVVYTQHSSTRHAGMLRMASGTPFLFLCSLSLCRHPKLCTAPT